jgi:hypothetical protein
MLRLLLLLLLMIAPAASAHELVKRTLECQCVLQTSICNLKIYDTIAGERRETWDQDFFHRKSELPAKSALNQACWRHREVSPRGGKGNCCFLSGSDEDAQRYYDAKFR